MPQVQIVQDQLPLFYDNMNKAQFTKQHIAHRYAPAFLCIMLAIGSVFLIRPHWAYAATGSITDSYTDTTKINTGSSTDYVVSGGQLKILLTKDNGMACSAGSECTSGFCTDSVCCNTACTGSTCQRCDSASSAGAGTCGYISTAVDPDNECGTTGCLTGSCSGTGYACGYSTSGTGACSTCQTCVGATSGSCVNTANGSTGLNCTATHYRCNGNGSCTAPTSNACFSNSPYIPDTSNSICNRVYGAQNAGCTRVDHEVNCTPDGNLASCSDYIGSVWWITCAVYSY